jgi:hypothetical protein
MMPARRWPTPGRIERIALEEAQDVGVATVLVLGATRQRAASRARKRSWARLMAEGFSIIGIATVWGCDRTGPQRVKRSMRAAGIVAE